MNQLIETTARALSGNFFETLQLRDSRLLNRLSQIVQSIERGPEKNFPAMFPKKAELEGFYRFVNNDRVDSSKIIDAACDSTVKATRHEQLILAIHDTSAFSFSSEVPIEGMGRLTKGKKGFFGHFCVATNKNRELLGLLGLKPWVRKEERIGRRTRDALLNDKDNEKLRWPKLIHEVQGKFTDSQNVIHVTDREPDDYKIFSSLVENSIRFVMRCTHNRKIKDKEYRKLFASLEVSPVVCKREVPVSPRKKQQLAHANKVHPERKKRIAQLGISAKTIEIRRGSNADPKLTPTLQLNYVRVFELQPPEGETPIEWILTTTEPIQNPDDLLHIVDVYCARWTVEEFFKALKTGCSYEKRGLESLHGLLNCLAIFAPIACKLYNLKMLGREQPEHNSQSAVTPTQIKILSKSTKQTEQQLQTMGPVMWAVAALGGHLKHNGLPGWQVLARGYEKLLQLEQGYLLAIELESKNFLATRVADLFSSGESS